MSLDVYLRAMVKSNIFEGGITHNLNKMAMAAELYTPLWRPEELFQSTIIKAHQLVPFLEKGLVTLKTEPERFKLFNPSNGYGTYEDLVSFVEKYLDALYQNPYAEVEVSR